MRSLMPADGELDADGIDVAYAWPDEPWLRVNMVTTVDGAVVAPDGLSRGIATRADAHLFAALRGRADALLIGAGTLRAERYRPAAAKPRYAQARAAAGQRPAPVIAVVSRSLAIDVADDLFVNPVERPIVLTVDSAPAAALAALSRVADVVRCGETDVDPTLALTALRERGLTWVHCEGGPNLLTLLAGHDLIDEWCVTVSPRLAGASYPDGTVPPRLLAGGPLPLSPTPLRLSHVLSEDGTLFLTYGRAG